MEQTERYRQAVTRLIEEYARFGKPLGEVRMEPVIDRERDHYELIQVGWIGRRRIHGCVLHIDIREGKVWIEHNGTDGRIAEELVEAGIPTQDIIVAFQPPEVRHLTGYGVG